MSRQNDDTVRLAAAVVMVELTQASLDSQPGDRKVIIEELGNYFSLSREVATRLENQSEQADESLTSLFPFTQLLNKNYNEQDKYQLIKALWEIAYQTGSGDRFNVEDAYCHKIANLLHIPHAWLMDGKLKAEQKYKAQNQ